MRRILVSGVLLFLMSALACSGRTPSGNDNDEMARAIPVTVGRAGLRTIAIEMSATGDVRPFAEAVVISEVAGVIEKLPVEKGQAIKAGEVIAVVEHAEASASVRQAEAAVQAARAQVVQAQATLANLDIEFERVRELFDSGTASKQMLDGISSKRDVAAAAKEVALAQVAQTEAALEQARVFLSNHTVRAPIGGVISERYVDEGDKNNPSQPIVSIAQVDHLKVICSFPERDLPVLRDGLPARLQVDAYPGEEFAAQVSIVSPVLDAAARTVSVELRAANSTGRLRPGMFARVTVTGDTVEILAVPEDALVSLPGTGGHFVFVVDGDIAQRVDLAIGRRAGKWTEVSGDIRQGAVVVVEGQTNLKSGGRVRVVSETDGTA